MKPDETNDPLDVMLRESEAYIEDAGFTARVMAALPPRRRSWLRAAILLGTTMVGLGLMVWWFPALKESFVMESKGELILNLSGSSLLVLGALLVAVASLFWGLFAVVRWED